MSIELPKLPYEYDELEPYIDEKTMRIHHTKHHQGYINKYNKAVQGTELEGKDIHEAMSDLDSVPQEIRTAVRNNGGGTVNHALFWEILCPESESGEPEGVLLEAIEESFGSMEDFIEEFEKAATGRFGSGWAWLVVNNGKLEVMSTPNQDTPLSQGKTPILGLDVWEHAYYLSYQNKRGEYVTGFWSIVNWEKVAENYDNA